MAFKNTVIKMDDRAIQSVFGQFDKNIRKIEKAFGVTYVCRGEDLILEGEADGVDGAERVIKDLLVICKNGSDITDQNVDYSIRLALEGSNHTISELDDSDIICHTLAGRPIRPKTHGQKKYVEAIDNEMIVFGTGPAGTGKTYLAMAKAITAFKKGDVERIILTRPAIEAGERLGFLPGDLQSKIDPYLRPLYDAL